MSKLTKKLLLILAILPFINYGQYTDQINSNRPGESMSAFSVGKNVFQVETGFYGIKEEHQLLKYTGNGFGLDFALRAGLFKEELEFIATVQYQNETVNSLFNSTNLSNLKKTNFGAKYLLYDPFKGYEKKVNLYSWKANHKFDWHQFIPAISVFAGANLLLADNPYSFTNKLSISPKIMLITQNHFGDGSWVFVTNIFADFIATDFPSYGYVMTMTKGFSPKWSGFVENQGFKSDFYSDAIIRGGAAFLLDKNLQIDASISNSFKNTPSILYGGIGLSWRYDAKHQDVKMKVDDGSSKKAKKRAKKTKKG